MYSPNTIIPQVAHISLMPVLSSLRVNCPPSYVQEVAYIISSKKWQMFSVPHGMPIHVL